MTESAKMEKLKMHSPDLASSNLSKLRTIFPNCVVETMDEENNRRLEVNFDLLKQEFQSSVDLAVRERYEINWPGKLASLVLANSPVMKTLRPDISESSGFASTRNLFIEGDNLDTLKLIQECYLNSVKLIYIDPPYNKGKDYIYSDRHTVDKAEYDVQSNQKDESGGRLVANTESNGRFHSDWLSMIYPRLKLSRNLMRDDGIIAISIDDDEVANLRKVCNEVFGEQNFVACLTWEKGRKNDAKFFSVGHEYILIFAKSIQVLRDKKIVWREEKPGAREIWDEYIRIKEEFGVDEALIENELRKWFSDLPKKHPSKKWSRYKRVDANGPWRDRDISWPGGGGPRYDVIHPKTGKPCKVPERGWIYSTSEEMQRQINIGLVVFREDETEPPFRKAHIRPIPNQDISDGPEEDEGEEELATQVRGTYFYKQSQVAVKYLRKLMGAKVFENPKDHIELSKLVTYLTADCEDAICLDFFAGSGSFAQAVAHSNTQDGGSRRFILVQLPETLNPKSKEHKSAIGLCKELSVPSNIAELAKERIRRASKEAMCSVPKEEQTVNVDWGFRVLKLDTSNMKDVYYSPDNVNQDDLFDQASNIKEDREPLDLLFQVLLDWGVDLSLHIAEEKIKDKTVFFVDQNALAACFDTDIDEDFVKELAARKPIRAVFRDASFGNDSVKINVEQIFKMISPSTELRCI